ncbi:hypothetical protein Tco_1555262 [Tanacetum coccineum]
MNIKDHRDCWYNPDYLNGSGTISPWILSPKLSKYRRRSCTIWVIVDRLTICNSLVNAIERNSTLWRRWQVIDLEMVGYKAFAISRVIIQYNSITLASTAAPFESTPLSKVSVSPGLLADVERSSTHRVQI